MKKLKKINSRLFFALLLISIPTALPAMITAISRLSVVASHITSSIEDPVELYERNKKLCSDLVYEIKLNTSQSREELLNRACEYFSQKDEVLRNTPSVYVREAVKSLHMNFERR